MFYIQYHWCIAELCKLSYSIKGNFSCGLLENTYNDITCVWELKLKYKGTCKNKNLIYLTQPECYVSGSASHMLETRVQGPWMS